MLLQSSKWRELACRENQQLESWYFPQLPHVRNVWTLRKLVHCGSLAERNLTIQFSSMHPFYCSKLNFVNIILVAPCGEVRVQARLENCCVKFYWMVFTNSLAHLLIWHRLLQLLILPLDLLNSPFLMICKSNNLSHVNISLQSEYLM